MTIPLVTAAITAYNAEDTIRAALASVLAQDWPSIEIIVIDDASSDGTVGVIEAFVCSQDDTKPSIRLIRQPRNGGVAQARNRLIEEARGEFIAFFDDDDISAPNRITQQYHRILEAERETGRDLVLCHTAREQLFPDGSSHYETTMGCEDSTIPVGDAVFDRILLGRISPGVIGSCATCSQMARKSVYLRLKGFDTALLRSEDTDLNIRCALQGGVFVGVAASLVRQTMTASAEKSPEAELEAYSVLLDRYREYVADHDWRHFLYQWRDIRRAYVLHRKGEFIARLLALGFRSPLKMAKKLRWSLPAGRSRWQLRRWQQNAFPGSSPGSGVS